MQLRVARLCLDCEEVHDGQVCPVCASEVFGYLSRWVPTPGARRRPKRTPAQAEVYHERTAPPATASHKWGLWASGALGVGALGMAGWIWRGKNKDQPETRVDQIADLARSKRA